MRSKLPRASWCIAFLFFSSCGGDPPSTLDARGPGAQRIEGLWWLMLWLSVAVFVIILVIFVYALLRSRRDVDPRAPVPWGDPFIAIGGLAIPFLILTGLFLVSLRDMHALSSPPTDVRLEIEIVGNDWWWEARYPNGAVTANEIHIPAGESVRLSLETDDVIHSFWVPQLQAKRDLNPGMTNHLWLQADEPGRYRGQCAEFCGLQHANMAFYVVARPPSEFQDWMENEAEPAPEPVTESESRGLEIFLGSTCVGCHTIRGTGADATIGPDLTHLARRGTIAAGIFENNRANLRRWILDPQSMKPGVTMPPTELSGEDIEALLDYLESLD